MSLWAVIKKEFLQIARDVRMLFMLIVVPAILLIFFGYVLSFDVRNIAVGLLDLDGSASSRDFVRSLTAGEYFSLRAVLHDRHELDRSLAEGSVMVGIVIPPRFGTLLEQGGTAPLQVLIDGSDGRKASIVQGYLQASVAAFTQRYLSAWAESKGHARAAPVAVEGRIWYNPELKSSLFLITGLIVFILMITGTISTALSVVRERERGTMEQLLVSPLSAVSVIVGKTIPYIIIASLSTTLILLVGMLLFGLVVKGSLVVLALAAFLFILAALAQGILISTLTTSQQVAFFVAALSSILPSLLLSGFIFPIQGMPPIIQAITVVVPARYFVDLLRAIMLRGAGIETGMIDLTALALFAFLMLAVASTRLKKKGLI
jgi:ABC-2 type transport system permease protein